MARTQKHKTCCVCANSTVHTIHCQLHAICTVHGMYAGTLHKQNVDILYMCLLITVAISFPVYSYTWASVNVYSNCSWSTQVQLGPFKV